MVDFSGDISPLVFKSAIQGDLGEFSLDTQMLKVLMALDGQKDVRAVVRATHLDSGTVRDVLARLHKINLVAVVADGIQIMDPAFMAYLADQLTRAVGPIAPVLIEDEVAALELDPARIPRHQAPELVDVLARQIPREEKRIAFQQAMLKQMNGMQ